jgi:hypothetical protein
LVIAISSESFGSTKGTTTGSALIEVSISKCPPNGSRPLSRHSPHVDRHDVLADSSTSTTRWLRSLSGSEHGGPRIAYNMWVEQIESSMPLRGVASISRSERKGSLISGKAHRAPKSVHRYDSEGLDTCNPESPYAIDILVPFS